MIDGTIDPDRELKRLNDAIKQYTLIMKTTIDPFQQKRVGKKLKQLVQYRDKILAMFDIEEEKIKEEKSDGEMENTYIFRLLQIDEGKEEIDTEVYHLKLYLDFFYSEFLAIFSERKLKLDFKYSMDRDNFHQKYTAVKRHMEDYIQEANRIREGAYNKDAEILMKRRNIKVKRNLFIESFHFLKGVQSFASDLIEDLESENLKCLNGDSILTFELIEEKRYLEGYTVKEALKELLTFSGEVLAFLNIPEIEKKDK